MEETETEAERVERGPSRRTVLKTAGAGTVGAAMLTGPSAAHKSPPMTQTTTNESDGQQASTYLFLFEHTAKRRTQIEGLPEAVQQGSQIAEEVGANLQSIYFGSIGMYDGLVILEFPDTESAEIFRLEFEREGTHTFEMFEIWVPEEYFQLVETATN